MCWMKRGCTGGAEAAAKMGSEACSGFRSLISCVERSPALFIDLHTRRFSPDLCCPGCLPLRLGIHCGIKEASPKSGGGRGCAAESACSDLRKSFWISKTDTLPFVKWTKRQGVRLFSSIGRKTKMQTNEMFAFWKGGATEQVRDGFLNKKAVANQCSPRRRVFSLHYR